MYAYVYACVLSYFTCTTQHPPPPEARIYLTLNTIWLNLIAPCEAYICRHVVIIGSDNVLSPILRQATTQNNAD